MQNHSYDYSSTPRLRRHACQLICGRVPADVATMRLSGTGSVANPLQSVALLDLLKLDGDHTGETQAEAIWQLLKG